MQINFVSNTVLDIKYTLQYFKMKNQFLNTYVIHWFAYASVFLVTADGQIIVCRNFIPVSLNIAVLCLTPCFKLINKKNLQK